MTDETDADTDDRNGQRLKETDRDTWLDLHCKKKVYGFSRPPPQGGGGGSTTEKKMIKK